LWEYFLGVVLSAYREFEQRVGLVTVSEAQSAIVFEVVARLPQQFQYADVERTCLALVGLQSTGLCKELRAKDKIRCIKSAEMRFGKNMII